MSKPTLGVIGCGNMGSFHAKAIAQSDSMELAAVCDVVAEKANTTAELYGVHAFSCDAELFRSGICDAVVIATPHYSHTTIGIAALEAGLHVLVEKPISVHKADCEKLIAAHSDDSKIFAAMFNQRTDPYYRAIKEHIDTGSLGTLQRITWVITNWFRPEMYYRSSPWRASWAGEGGGLLMNQCMHQLDLLQWLCGMPNLVRAHCGFGKYHAIEVEDEVSAYLEYAAGATGTFVASSAEYPGANRLEIAGTCGTLLLENDLLTVTTVEPASDQFCKESQELFAVPSISKKEYTFPDHGGQHREVLENFVNAIAGTEELLIPACEGIHAVELANALLFSARNSCDVPLPIDSGKYADFLQALIAESDIPAERPEATCGTIDADYLEELEQKRWRSHR